MTMTVAMVLAMSVAMSLGAICNVNGKLQIANVSGNGNFSYNGSGNDNGNGNENGNYWQVQTLYKQHEMKTLTILDLFWQSFYSPHLSDLYPW